MERQGPLRFYGGAYAVFAPFVLFLTGVAWLGLSGAPDERGFWPILLTALSLGMVLSRERIRFSEIVIAGMSRPLVIIMILAWLLAGVLGKIMQETGFVEAMTWVATRAGVEGGAYVVTAFFICCIVSTATGTSLGTLLVCGPLLYPAGGPLGATPAILAGAIIGGATFGDNVSPISDTTIASALTQDADIAGVVKSRLRYALLAAAIALVAYGALGSAGTSLDERPDIAANPNGLVMLIVPVLVVALLLRGHHLLEGLIFGILTAAAVGLVFELVEPSALLYIDQERYAARGHARRRHGARDRCVDLHAASDGTRRAARSVRHARPPRPFGVRSRAVAAHRRRMDCGRDDGGRPHHDAQHRGDPDGRRLYESRGASDSRSPNTEEPT